MKITILTITFAALTTAFASASDKFGQAIFSQSSGISIFDPKPEQGPDCGPPRTVKPAPKNPFKPTREIIIIDDLPPRPSCGGPNNKILNQSMQIR